ncbi:RNA-directed DNA polymerase, eukaryota, reverse transcriptase zinc-binding domain protein [Tanacetum coccineum]
MNIHEIRNEDGLNKVIEKGPWMIKNKPLIVKKWSLELGMKKVETKKVPVWIKLVNVPLEAWSVEGLSSLSSSVGKPILMDTTTAAMCHTGNGSFDYTKVLVEMDTEKKFKNEVEIQYRDNMNKVKDMISYFKEKWKKDRRKEEQEKNVGTVVEDVMEDITGTTKLIKDNVMTGIEYCKKGCRIVLGWDSSKVNIQVINKTNQSIYCLVSVEQYNVDQWGKDVEVHRMYRVVMKLKNLKSHLNHLGWKKGSLFKRVVDLRNDLQRVQTEINVDPHNAQLRDKEADLLKEFLEAEADEEKLDVTDVEIKDAMFDIDDTKAPRPDGFTTVFFKKSWSIIRKDICCVVKEFFTNGKLLGKLNATLISLILKVQNPTKCVTTTKFTLCVNGERIGYFKGGRGLRQGDPVSPYLFTFIMEVFSLMLKRQIDKEAEFQYNHLMNSVKLSYGSAFIDDLLSCVMLEAFLWGIKKLLMNSVLVQAYSPIYLRALLQLISVVLESIHVYWSSVFLLPVTVINDIISLLKRFLWNQGESAKGKAKVAWANICRPKSKGGLGLKDLQI